MSKKIIYYSNQTNQNREIPKPQIQLRNQYENTKNSVQIQKDRLGSQSQQSLQKVIYQKINDVQNENKKLLEISNRLQNSQTMCNTQQNLNPIIYTIEEQMKTAFNELIQSIQQFYIDIDRKVKQIGTYLASLSDYDTLQTSKNCKQQVFTLNNQQSRHTSPKNDNQSLKFIHKKISNLEKDLQETKSNEQKLMVIIQRLISKYEVNHETTIVKEDPFLKKKLNNLLGRLQANQTKEIIGSQKPNAQHVYTSPIDRRSEGNTFVRVNPSSYEKSVHQTSSNNLLKSPFFVSNAQKKSQQNTQRVVQNPNDYSLYHELDKLEQNALDRQRQFIQVKNKLKSKEPRLQMSINKSKFDQGSDKLGTSTISVTSYAYSNSMQEPVQDQCFIKKLYSKQPQSLNKMSLKGFNNSFIQFKQKDQTIDPSNRNHREAFLLHNLKRNH